MNEIRSNETIEKKAEDFEKTNEFITYFFNIGNFR